MGPRFSAEAYGPFLLPRRQRRCFYCSCALVHSSCFPAHGPFPDNLATQDHVFPRSRLSEIVGIPSEVWFRLNRVPACARCNLAKGATYPVEWLTKLTCPDGRYRLVQRLNSLGAFALVSSVRPSEWTPHEGERSRDSMHRKWCPPKEKA